MSDGTGPPVDPDRCVADFTDKVNTLLADTALAERMGAAGRERAVSRFSWQEVARRTHDLYRSLVSG